MEAEQFSQFYNSLPKFTRFYMIAVFVTTLCISYFKFLPVGYYLVLDIDRVMNNYQIWRLFTNFFIVGKFSFNFLFFMLMIYNTLVKMEKKAVEIRRYSEFVMLLVYTTSFILLVTFLMYYLFGMDVKPFLCMELLFSLIYIEAKRDPEKMVMVWFITVKNAYLPFVLMGFSMITGGDIISNMIGIAAGHLYFYLKDIAPLHHGTDWLKTPQFVFNYFDRNPRATVTQTNTTSGVRGVNNSNASGSFGSSNPNPTNTSTTLRSDTNTGTGNQFQPFQGRGSSWGS